MKNKKIIRKFTVLLAALVIMCGFSVTAYAGGGDESDDTPTPVTEETPAPETEPEETTGGYEPQPLTPDGNMSLVDDITGEASGDKQFITVVTKSGNYFYIIIDRAEDGENTVHFLNQVDEADLTALMEDGQTEAPVCSCTDKCVAGSVNTACPVCSVNMSECAGVEAEPEPEETEQPPEEEKGGGMGILLVVLLVAAAGARGNSFSALSMNRRIAKSPFPAFGLAAWKQVQSARAFQISKTGAAMTTSINPRFAEQRPIGSLALTRPAFSLSSTIKH